MCCPGRVLRGETGVALLAPRSMAVGASGLADVEYSGIMAMDECPGAVTGVRYKFGRERQRFYVDRRDLPGFLDYVEHGVKVFREKLA